jgi:tetratricopeptide (TPR) repeat protein
LVDADPFMRGSAQTISWFAENRNLVIGAVGLALVVGVVAYVAQNMMRQQAIEASAGVSSALEAYEIPVEGSPAHKALTSSRNNIPAPDKTFKSEKERWTAVYERAGKTLDEHADSAAAQVARITRAAAAARLGKPDESLKLYNAYLEGPTDEAALPVVYYGRAVAQAENGKFDAAAGSLDKMVEADKEYKSFALYHKGLFMEEAGNIEKAKEFYNQALESDPKTPYKTDIKRRIALF